MRIPGVPSQVSVPYEMLVPMGDVPGVSAFFKYGSNADIDTGSDPEDVWDQGDLYVFPDSAETVNVRSTNSNDDAATGTGAFTVRLFGLDENFEEIQEDVTLDGIVDVTTTQSFRRGFRAYVLTCGDFGTNQGAITFTQSTSGIVLAQITQQQGQTLMAVYTVPAGKTLYVSNFFWSQRRTGGPAGLMCDVSLLFRVGADESGLPGVRPWRTQQTVGSSLDGSVPYIQPYTPHLKFEEKTDIVVRVAYVSDNNAGVDAGWGGYLVDN